MEEQTHSFCKSLGMQPQDIGNLLQNVVQLMKQQTEQLPPADDSLSQADTQPASPLDRAKMVKRKKKRIGKTPMEKINWSSEEDEELRRLVSIYGEQSWHRLCRFMPNKTEIRCFKRWLQLKCKGKESEDPQQHVVLGKSSQWSPEEDQLLTEKVEQFGT